IRVKRGPHSTQATARRCGPSPSTCGWLAFSDIEADRRHTSLLHDLERTINPVQRLADCALLTSTAARAHARSFTKASVLLRDADLLLASLRVGVDAPAVIWQSIGGKARKTGFRRDAPLWTDPK